MNKARSAFSLWFPYVLLLFWGVFFSFILEDFRVIMGDEACYIDPAIRLHEGKGFTSIAWAQPTDLLWSSNFPLHVFLSYVWIRLTGAGSLWGYRMFSLVFFLVGLGLWIHTMRKHGVFTRLIHDIGFLGLFSLSLYGLAPSQIIRPEALSTVLLGLLTLVPTLRNTKIRTASAFFTGIFFCLAGLQFVLAAAWISTLWLLHRKAKGIQAYLGFILGGVSGFLFLLLFYRHHGTLEIFLSETFGHPSNQLQQWMGWRDPMLWACVAALTGLMLCGQMHKQHRNYLALATLLGIGMPLTFFLLSKFPQYYAHFTLLPLTSATAHLVPECRIRWVKSLCWSGLACAALLGFPLTALLSWNNFDQRSHSELVQWLENNLDGDEILFMNPSAYFGARRLVRAHYTQFSMRGISETQKQDIDTLIVWKDHAGHDLGFPSLSEQLGGEWQLQSTFLSNENHPRRLEKLAILENLSYAPTYRFELYRREE